MATCCLTNAEERVSNYCITDNNDRFFLERKPSDKYLVVSYLGYSTVKLNVDRIGTDMRIGLKPSEKSLNEVVVTPPPILKHNDT